MQISNYLHNIKQGKPINFDNFIKKLTMEGYGDQTILTIFSTQKRSKFRYQVSIIDEQQFALLQTNFPDYTITDRVSAAQAGNSHKHPVSQSMVILWPHQQNHPVVILNDAKGIKKTVTLGRRLLIIENQENFVQKDQTLAFLKHQFADFNDDALDIAHGSGNAISNRLNKAFFNHYPQIDCLLDLDIGGLTTFANLSELTSHPRLNFLLPPCADQLLGESKLALQNKHRAALCKFKQNHPALRPAIDLMIHHKKMLEQEMYLQD
jgi:hypothetical protein